MEIPTSAGRKWRAARKAAAEKVEVLSSVSVTSKHRATDVIPKLHAGAEVEGHVIRLDRLGVFIDIGVEREGLLSWRDAPMHAWGLKVGDSVHGLRVENASMASRHVLLILPPEVLEVKPQEHNMQKAAVPKKRVISKKAERRVLRDSKGGMYSACDHDLQDLHDSQEARPLVSSSSPADVTGIADMRQATSVERRAATSKEERLKDMQRRLKETSVEEEVDLPKTKRIATKKTARREDIEMQDEWPNYQAEDALMPVSQAEEDRRVAKKSKAASKGKATATKELAGKELDTARKIANLKASREARVSANVTPTSEGEETDQVETRSEVANLQAKIAAKGEQDVKRRTADTKIQIEKCDQRTFARSSNSRWKPWEPDDVNDVNGNLAATVFDGKLSVGQHLAQQCIKSPRPALAAQDWAAQDWAPSLKHMRDKYPSSNQGEASSRGRMQNHKAVRKSQGETPTAKHSVSREKLSQEQGLELMALIGKRSLQEKGDELLAPTRRAAKEQSRPSVDRNDSDVHWKSRTQQEDSAWKAYNIIAAEKQRCQNRDREALPASSHITVEASPEPSPEPFQDGGWETSPGSYKSDEEWPKISQAEGGETPSESSYSKGAVWPKPSQNSCWDPSSDNDAKGRAMPNEDFEKMMMMTVTSHYGMPKASYVVRQGEAQNKWVSEAHDEDRGYVPAHDTLSDQFEQVDIKSNRNDNDDDDHDNELIHDELATPRTGNETPPSGMVLDVDPNVFSPMEESSAVLDVDLNAFSGTEESQVGSSESRISESLLANLKKLLAPIDTEDGVTPEEWPVLHGAAQVWPSLSASLNSKAPKPSTHIASTQAKMIQPVTDHSSARNESRKGRRKYVPMEVQHPHLQDPNQDSNLRKEPSLLSGKPQVTERPMAVYGATLAGTLDSEDSNKNNSILEGRGPNNVITAAEFGGPKRSILEKRTIGNQMDPETWRRAAGDRSKSAPPRKASDEDEPAPGNWASSEKTNLLTGPWPGWEASGPSSWPKSFSPLIDTGGNAADGNKDALDVQKSGSGCESSFGASFLSNAELEWQELRATHSRLKQLGINVGPPPPPAFNWYLSEERLATRLNPEWSSGMNSRQKERNDSYYFRKSSGSSRRGEEFSSRSLPPPRDRMAFGLQNPQLGPPGPGTGPMSSMPSFLPGGFGNVFEPSTFRPPRGPYLPPMCSPMDWYGPGANYQSMSSFSVLPPCFGQGALEGMPGYNSWSISSTSLNPEAPGFAPGVWLPQQPIEDVSLFETTSNVPDEWRATSVTGEWTSPPASFIMGGPSNFDPYTSPIIPDPYKTGLNNLDSHTGMGNLDFSKTDSNNSDLCRAPEAAGMSIVGRILSHIRKGDLQRRQWESFANRHLNGNRDVSSHDDAHLLPFVNQYVA